MARLTSIGLRVFLMLSGAAVAQQATDQQKGSPMPGMMGYVMQGEKSAKGSMGDMKSMMKVTGQVSCPK